MSAESESALYKPLFAGLNVLFKWDIDTNPHISRDNLSPSQTPQVRQIPSIMIGGSNANRLREAMGHMGMEVVDITSGGWSLTPANLQTVKCLIQAECDTKPDSPVIIYGLDNSCFMCLTAAGQLTPITRSTEDNKYHVDGDLAITPPILLKPMFDTLSEIVAICGSRLVYILTPLPRYVLVPCCFKDSHCANLVVKDDATRQVVLGLMDELDQVCRLVKTKFPTCKVINTGDLLAGKDGASKLEVLDAMIANWMTDPVHGDKAGYARVAVKLIEKMEEKPSALPTPETAASGGHAGSLPATAVAPSSGSGRGRGRGANDTGSGGIGRTFTHRNHEYQSGFDSRYRRDRWDSAPYQFTRGGNRGGRGCRRGGTRGGGYF